MEVTLEGVRASRAGGFRLDIPSLRLPGGRTTAILGPNGSGKTTLLRLLAGLERPDAGRILAAGFPVRPKDHVAYVFQEKVFLRASVRENLELGLKLRGVGPAARRTRVDDAARLLGIVHLMDRRADRLSGGEGRRAGLARALCLQAPLVLLDEPLAGLDERTYSTLLDELPRLLAAFQATTLLVTHNRQEALRLAEHLVVVVNGRVHAAGDTRQIASNPPGREVAEVLGYTVLRVDGCLIAVPPGAFRHGRGPYELTMVVEHVVDLVERREIVGRLDDVRVHAVLPADVDPPQPGQRVTVHAERACTL